MTKAPERIWAFLDGPFVGMFVSGGIKDGGTEYLRADLALALVAAEREAWAIEMLSHIAAYKSIGQKGAYPRLNESFVNTIRARTPDDATAALKARDQRIRNEALREALAIAEERTPSKHGGALASHVTGCAIQAGISKLITEGQSDGE